MKNTLGKDFYAAAPFKGLWDNSFETIKKLVEYFSLYQPFLHFLRREDQQLFIGSKFSVLYVDA